MSPLGWILVIILLAALGGILSVTIQQSVTIGGKSMSGGITRDAATELSSRVTLPIGLAGTLSTRTTDTTGTLTLGAGHGLIDGNIIDIYWGSGTTAGIRRGVTVGVVAGTSVPISLGAGDVLPAVTTVIVASKVVTINIDFDGDEALLVAAAGSRRNSIAFQQNDGTAILNLDLGKAGTDGEAWFWWTHGPVTNPFVGVDIGRVRVSNGSIVGTAQVTVGAVIDNDV